VFGDGNIVCCAAIFLGWSQGIFGTEWIEGGKRGGGQISRCFSIKSVVEHAHALQKEAIGNDRNLLLHFHHAVLRGYGHMPVVQQALEIDLRYGGV